LDDSKSQGRCWGEPLENKRYKKLRGSDQVQPDAWGQSIGWPCRDGKSRTIPTEPALFPLADGVSNRVGTLRGAGNAIVPQVAAEVIKAFMVSEDEK
jgi:DNA (cytosine-5)-methyltransferase 1